MNNLNGIENQIYSIHLQVQVIRSCLYKIRQIFPISRLFVDDAALSIEIHAKLRRLCILYNGDAVDQATILSVIITKYKLAVNFIYC
jgi:hypothetical protein